MRDGLNEPGEDFIGTRVGNRIKMRLPMYKVRLRSSRALRENLARQKRRGIGKPCAMLVRKRRDGGA